MKNKTTNIHSITLVVDTIMEVLGIREEVTETLLKKLEKRKQ